MYFRILKVPYVLMHMQGTPQTMQDAPQYEDVVEDIFNYLRQRWCRLREFGIEPEAICLDPGIGFGKTHEHNLQLLRHVSRFLDLNSPLLVGHSRKGFIGSLLGDREVERDSGTTSRFASNKQHNNTTTHKYIIVVSLFLVVLQYIE